MHPLLRLILGLAVLLLMLAGVGLALPSQVTIARSDVINAPEGIVFSNLNNLRRFNEWSPWAARDPQLKVTFAGPEEGAGARIEWSSGKRSVGEGSMEILESAPSRRIDLAVNFHDLQGQSYFDVVPAGSGSKVTWGFTYDTGPNPLRRWTGLMLDRLLGAEFRDGLVKLKDRIESERRPLAPVGEESLPMPAPDGSATVAPVVPGAPAETPAPAQPTAPPAPPPQP